MVNWKRFFTKFTKSENCWEWTAAKFKNGYGAFNVNGSIKYAHRLSWEYYNGPIFNNLFVLHTCDNRACVNPKHLWLGTCKDNMTDCSKKGRHMSSSRKGENFPHFGKPKSIETRQKIAIANTGKKASDETKIKLSESHKGKKASDETKKKMSISRIKYLDKIMGRT